MTLKTFGLLCGVSLAMLTFTIRSGQKLENVERAYLVSGKADFSRETLGRPSAYIAGQIFKIASGNSYPTDKVRELAVESAARRHKDAGWVEEFMRGYESPANAAAKAPAEIPSWP